jgi:hypothetical protein
LVAQLDHLDNLLLSGVSTTFPDELTDEEKAATNAYLVLSHAVLEEFLESVFESHFDRLAGWLIGDLVPLEVARLMFAAGELLPSHTLPTYEKRSLTYMKKACKAFFLKELSQNNGLKPDNLKKLARLVGLDWAAFDGELSSQLADLQTLGVRRGDAGHLSPYSTKAIFLTRQDYPENVREWVHGGRDAALTVRSYLAGVVQRQQPRSLIVDWDGN